MVPGRPKASHFSQQNSGGPRFENPGSSQLEITGLTNTLARHAFNGDIDSIVRSLLLGARHLIKCDCVVLVTNDEANPGWWVFKSLDHRERWVIHLQPDDQKTALSKAIHAGKPVQLEGGEVGFNFDPICASQKMLQSMSLACMPFAAESEIQGAILVLNQETSFFDNYTLSTLTDLASSASISLQTARRVQEYRLLAASQATKGLDEFPTNLLFQSIIDQLPISLYIIDQDYKLLAINRYRSERALHPSNVLLGFPCYQVLFGLDSPCPDCRVMETLQSNQNTTRIEHRQDVGGHMFEWEIKSYPVPTSIGDPAQALLLETDITEKRYLESVLIQSEKLAAVGQLAAGIAHEINNPLTAIIANAQILHREIPPESDLQESVDLISRAGARAAQVVRNLLDFARKEEYRLGRTDLNQTIERALELIQHELLARGVRIELRLTPKLPSILGSADHLQSVWLNLLLNAIDSLDKTPQTIGISSHLQKNDVQVVFQDNGKGISAEHMAHIFEPFFTTKGPGRGTGLGLSVSHRIIEQHGGTIHVESRLGEGSVFTVTLPTT